jgi:hypothetical protein
MRYVSAFMTTNRNEINKIARDAFGEGRGDTCLLKP